MFPSFFDLLLFLLSKIAMCDLQFSFLYIKKSRFSCVVQILFVTLRRFCIVPTLHLQY
jgi:hypothetical protein